MTIGLGDTTITLAGACGVEEVEVLVNHLEKQPDLPVDLSAATTIHTALWQALMAFRPKLTGAPTSFFIADKALPGLNAYFAEKREL